MITVQCLAGHVYESNDPELVARNTARQARGFLDALILSCEECDDCKEELHRRNAKYADYDMED